MTEMDLKDTIQLDLANLEIIINRILNSNIVMTYSQARDFRELENTMSRLTLELND